jgi:hypothetical protein
LVLMDAAAGLLTHRTLLHARDLCVVFCGAITLP